jgi:MOSC domain-containing protein YiiM
VSPGRVESIHVATSHSEATRPVERAQVLAGRGIAGDRHFADQGHDRGEGRDLTLVQAEAIEALHEEAGIDVPPGGARRNVVTRGIDLNGLVGRRFRVGEVECLGIELCEPCRHLERLTQPGVLRGLVHRGGLRADVLVGGRIAVGDPVRQVSGQPPP